MRNYSKINVLILSVFSVLLITGCGSNPIKQLNVVGTHNQNLDIAGAALPTHVKVYQLKSYEAFNNLSFNDFAQNQDKKVLGDSLMSITEHVIDPARSLSLNPLLQEDTQYVAFAALFRKPDAEQWKTIAKRKKLEGKKVFLKVEGCYVRIVDHKDRTFIFKPTLEDRPEEQNASSGLATPDCSTASSSKNSDLSADKNIPVLNPEDENPEQF